jgi:chromosome segregation ATPase
MAASDPLQDLRLLASDYDNFQVLIQTARAKLIKLARIQADQRAQAEMEAMYLEDIIGHSPNVLLGYYAPVPSDISKQQAKFALKTALISYMKRNAKAPDLRNDVEQIMTKISQQQNLLIEQESAISQLREEELKARQSEDELYRTLMEKVHARADEYQAAHTSNKAKRRELAQIERGNSELRQTLGIAKKHLEEANERLRLIRKDTGNLADRKQIAEERLIHLTETESRVDELRKENKANLRKLEELERVLRKSERELEKKRNEMDNLISEIEGRQKEIDEVMLKYGRSGLILQEDEEIWSMAEEEELIERINSQIDLWLQNDV